MGNVFMIRHGQASAFEENYDRLSTLGERQARLLGETWARRGFKPDRVFTGPRMRHERTAEIALANNITLNWAALEENGYLTPNNQNAVKAEECRIIKRPEGLDS